MAEYFDVNQYTKELEERIKRAGSRLEERMASDVAQALNKTTKGDDSISVRNSGKKVIVEFEEESTVDDIVDLKRFFKASPNAKETKDGGWYMVIPIRRYTGRQRETREKSTGMTNRLYQDLLSKQPPKGYQELASDYLYDNRRGGSPIKELNYTPKSKGITRIPQQYRGHQYVSFRTVSDRSHPASWIVNRDKIRPNQKTAEVRRIVDEVKRFNYSRRL